MKVVRNAFAALVFLFAVSTFASAEPASKTIPGLSPDAGFGAEVGNRHEWLDKGYRDWSDSWVRLQQKFEEGGFLYGAARQTERFSIGDNEYSAGVYQPVTNAVSFTAEAGYSPTHQVLARWSAFAGMETAVSGWGFAAGYKRTEYDLSRVDMGVFRMEKYAGDFRAAYTFYPVHVDNAGSVSSHAFRLDWYYGDKSFAGVGYAAGREAESDGASGALVSDIEEYSIAWNHWMSRDWLVAVDAGTHRQSPYYTRNWVSIGIRRAF